MCIVCRNKPPTNGIVDCKSCINLTNDILKGYVEKHTIKKLYCYETKITEIPYIKGLDLLYCSGVKITKIPHIEGLSRIHC